MKVIKNVILILKIVYDYQREMIFKYFNSFFNFIAYCLILLGNMIEKNHLPKMYDSLDAQNLKFKSLTDSKYVLNTTVKKIT